MAPGNENEIQTPHHGMGRILHDLTSAPLPSPTLSCLPYTGEVEELGR